MLGIGPVTATEYKDIPDLLYFDGSQWNRIERISPEWAPTFKTFLVRGIYEGAYTVNPQMFTEQFNNDASLREIVKELDVFYSDERNLKTPVAYALMMSTKAKVKATQKTRTSTSTLVSKGNSS